MVTLLAAVWLALSPVSAPGTLELHAESAPNAANARAWTMPGPRGTETVYLDAEVLLDASSVATAEVVSAPGGGPQIRLDLTADGASRLQSVTARLVGRRIGVVAGGKLRATPYVTGAVTGGTFFVMGNMTAAEAEAIAAKIAPPPVRPAPVVPSGPGIPELQGLWKVSSATFEGKPVAEPKILGASWSFHGSELLLTTGDGQSMRFVVQPDGPGAVHLAPMAPSKEKGGSVLWAREGAELVLAFKDSLESKPEALRPGPKTVVARLKAAGAR
jgi:uncharacterized protein (TIGR03067 family)